MKNIFKSIFTMAIGFVSLNTFAINQSPTATSVALNAHASDSTLSLNVSDMDCPLDAKLVEKALFRKGGVKNVEIKDSLVIVTYNPKKISKNDIIAVIENTGTCEDPNHKIHKVSIKWD